MYYNRSQQRTLESLFAVFVLLHVRHHKCKHFATTYMKKNSKFQNNSHYGREAKKKLILHNI